MVNAAIILGEIKNKIVELSDKVDDKAIEDISQKLAKCSWKILTIGTGKSGIIANEISSLLSTSGTVSFTINPLSALHGEIGTIENGDALIIFSKSGETSEIVRLLSYLKKRICTLCL